MTVSITPEPLADYLRRHEEEYGAINPMEDEELGDHPAEPATSDTSED